jgi:thymidylate synthase ThyX
MHVVLQFILKLFPQRLSRCFVNQWLGHRIFSPIISSIRPVRCRDSQEVA